MQRRTLREGQVDAERLLLATQSALEADGELLSDDERRAVGALMDRLRILAAGSDPDAITASAEALAKGTESFAAARMNRGLRLALAGRSIEDV
jgi:molecular chaperone HscA